MKEFTHGEYKKLISILINLDHLEVETECKENKDIVKHTSQLVRELSHELLQATNRG